VIAMDEDQKNKLKEIGSKIDDQVEVIATKHEVPKWVVWAVGVVAVLVLIKLIF
jgi:hypothetical protein